MTNSLPTNIKAEQQLIGAVLNDSDALQKIPHIKPEHFSHKAHQKAWEIITKMAQADIVGLMVELNHLKITVNIDGYEGEKYFQYCQSLALSGLLVEGYAEGVFKAWFGRLAINQFQSIILEAEKMALPSYGIEDFISKINATYTEIHKAQKPITNSGPKSAEEIVRDELLPRIDARRNGTLKTISTGLTALDKAISGGLEEGTGSVLLIGGDSGSGKSELTATIFRSVLRQGKTVLLFTMEMDNWQYLQRIIQMEYELSRFQFVKPNLLSDKQFAEFRELISNTRPRIYIDDGNSISPNYIFMTVQNMINLGLRPDLVGVDYVSLQSVNEGDKHSVRSDTQKISYLHGNIKSIARHFGIPFLAVEQYNKQVMGQKPSLASIKGNAHADADTVLGLFWPNEEKKNGIYRHRNYNLKRDIGQVHIPKNRLGEEREFFEVSRNEYSGLLTDVTPSPKK